MPLKSNELSNLDILKILKNQKININGIFMKDELPKLKEGFYIVNLASEKANNGGTHWLTFYYTPDRLSLIHISEPTRPY